MRLLICILIIVSAMFLGINSTVTADEMKEKSIDEAYQDAINNISDIPLEVLEEEYFQTTNSLYHNNGSKNDLSNDNENYPGSHYLNPYEQVTVYP